MLRSVGITIDMGKTGSIRANVRLDMKELTRDEAQRVANVAAEEVADALRKLPYLPYVTVNNIKFK
jgi:hypothetical protein